MNAGVKGALKRGSIIIPGAVFLLALFVLPLMGLLVTSFRPTDEFNDPLPGWTAQHYLEVFNNPYSFRALGYTVALAVLVTALSGVLAYPVSWLLVRARTPLVRTLIIIVVISPLLTSVVVRSFGWRIILAANGPINTILTKLDLVDTPLRLLTGVGTVIVVVTHVLLPFMIVTLSTSLGKIEESLIRASSSMGATPLRTFLRVIFPLSVPGLASGAVIVFSLTMGIYVTPLLVGGANQPLAGLRVYDTSLRVFNQPLAAALSFILFGISLIAIIAINAISKTWERRFYD